MGYTETDAFLIALSQSLLLLISATQSDHPDRNCMTGTVPNCQRAKRAVISNVVEIQKPRKLLLHVSVNISGFHICTSVFVHPMPKILLLYFFILWIYLFIYFEVL